MQRAQGKSNARALLALIKDLSSPGPKSSWAEETTTLRMGGMDGRCGAAWGACVVPKTTTGTVENDQRGLIGRVRGKTLKGVAGDLCPVYGLKELNAAPWALKSQVLEDLLAGQGLQLRVRIAHK